MIEVIIGIVMSIITQLTKKTGVDAKIIILALSVVVGTVFYFLKEAYPEMIDVVYQKVLGAYAVSQVVYNYVISWFEDKKDKEKKTRSTR